MLVEVARNTLRPAWRWSRRAAYHARQHRRDRVYGIATHVAVPPSGELPDEGNYYYEPARYEALDQVAARLPLTTRDVVCDVGCGMGRVVCYFARLPIGGAVGIEIDADLATQARENADKLKSKKTDINILSEDARLSDYTGVTVLFLYNPFGKAILKDVVERFLSFAVRSESDVRIVYMNPMHRDVLDAMPMLRHERDMQVPYDLGSVEAVVWAVRSDLEFEV